MNAQKFFELNISVSDAIHLVINNHMSADLTAQNFETIKALAAPLFMLKPECCSIHTDPSYWFHSPWDQCVESAEEYALCALSIQLETDEFFIAVPDYDEVYPKIAKFLAAARDAGCNSDHFRKYIDFLSRDNEDVKRMIENLL